MIKLKYLPLILLILFLTGCDAIREAELNRIAQKYQDGQLEEARDEMVSFLEKDKDNALGWTILGHIYNDLDDMENAETAYLAALEIDPEMAEALTGMGIVSRMKGEYEQAAEYYYRSITADPEYGQAYSSLLVIELKRGNFAEAVTLGEKGYELDRTDPAIASNLSIAYHYHGDTINRDKYYAIAADLGYDKLETVQLIFAGELTVLD